MQCKRLTGAIVLACSVLSAQATLAAVSEEEAARLGKDLNPFGGELPSPLLDLYPLNSSPTGSRSA